MKPVYRFEKTLTVDGTPYRAGDLVTADQIPAGYFESCVRLGHLAEVAERPDPADTFAAAMEAGLPDAAVPTAPADPPTANPIVGPPAEPPGEPPAEVPKPKRKK